MANTELTLIDTIQKDLIIKDGTEYNIPMSTIFGKGILPKEESFGGRSLAENAQKVDIALRETKPLDNIWNRSHSQWTWRHINLSYYSPWKNMRQIAAELSRKRQALNEAKWRYVKNEVKLRKLEEKLNYSENVENDYWNEVDTKVKIAELKEQMAEGMMYIEGAMKDTLTLHEMYNQLQEKIKGFTEEDFEKAESKSHLMRSLIQCIRDVRQFGSITKGEQEYMEQIGVNPSKIQKLIRAYIESENESDDWSTDGLMEFAQKVTDDLIDNKKVDVKRMAIMGFRDEVLPEIGYDKPIGKDD